MSYLEQLKREKTYPEAPPKLPKPPFDSFGGRGGRHFSEKKAPVATTHPRPTEARDGGRFDDAGMYQGYPTPAAVDVADAILDHLVAEGCPTAEKTILRAVGGNPETVAAILRRLVIDGIVEPASGGKYRLPVYPPPPGCPLADPGALCPSGCQFETPMLRRMIAGGTLPLPGGRCPLRKICGLDQGPDHNPAG